MTTAPFNRRPLYEHRQTGWPILASALVPFVCLAGWWWAFPPGDRHLPTQLVSLPWWAVPSVDRGPAVHLVPVLCGLAFVALGFSWLTVVLTETQLVVRFGVGLFRRVIPLADIRLTSVTRSRWYEGWGIRWTRRGMLYNVSGFDAVALELENGKTLRIGSDDAVRLRQALDRAIEAVHSRAATR